ncbi:MAG: LysM peptidoglycan-binding domain-containing M23 family metallopeptidase [Armatimonadota bacterium]
MADVQPAKTSVQPAGPASRRADPAGATVAHVVAPGETPWKIAAAYGVRVEDVLTHNGLREGDVIKPGRRLMIPTRPTAPVPEPGNVEARKGAVKPPAQVGPDRVFLWPTRGIITSRFGWRRYRRHHEGIDLASPHGTPIYATRDGIVEYSGVRNGYGQVVYVDHGGGLVTVYGHASELLVAAGQRVKRGQMIARVGCTGVCTGAHVHFEVRINGVAVNPLQYLR